MYSYEWDPETGGILLTSSALLFSKEPRPVYYKELDILGFDKKWQYAKDDLRPYMWAEANNYYYRGRLVARTKGGSAYSAPQIEYIEEPEPSGLPLRFVDIDLMVRKNRRLLEALAEDTIKKIYNTYAKYEKRIDVFYVAFSGGKDSIVTLDLVQKALPHNEFKVVFGDTGMEFPDTYDTVHSVEEWCRTKGIVFLKAKSQFDPKDSWIKFGPPATVTRWCCSVHKTVPQILMLRQYTGKPNFTGMAFVGVRGSESLARSGYKYLSIGKKHKGQYSCNPILEWNSAELFLYIYSENLHFNEAYKKGNRRVGCLVCPRAASRSDYICRVCYPNQFDNLCGAIKFVYKESFDSEEKLINFIDNGGWKARKNGRDIAIGLNYNELLIDNVPSIKITNPQTDWKQWIKTIGVLLNNFSPYKILYRSSIYQFSVTEENGNLLVQYEQSLIKEAPVFVKLLKSTFRKSACCLKCGTCEADCHNGFISMKNGVLKIDDRCTHCSMCHSVEKGCLIYKSLEMPKGGLKMSATKSLNCYSHHAPKIEWLKQFFELKNEFDDKHTLGSKMYSFFKRFLRDAGLLDKNGFSRFAEVIDHLGLDNLSSWGLMLANLAYTPQINWFVKRIKLNETISKEYAIEQLINDGAKESWVGDVWSSFKRMLALPFSEVGLGRPENAEISLKSVTKTAWRTPDPVVVLYSLYKFAEACDGYYQFSLNRLFEYSIDSNGVSPTEIYGIERDYMAKLLKGLSAKYPDFINASFTLDLESITLDKAKSSNDVLEIFFEV